MADPEIVTSFFRDANFNGYTTTTEMSGLEAKELFNGDLSDINVWIIHEEFRLKKKKEDSERVLRESNAKKAFIFSSVWAVFIGVFILLHGFESISFFKVGETEFLFVCGTLTTSILIFYLVVLKNLFPSHSDNSKHSEKAKN